jgi:hypothetical protein
MPDYWFGTLESDHYASEEEYVLRRDTEELLQGSLVALTVPVLVAPPEAGRQDGTAWQGRPGLI